MSEPTSPQPTAPRTLGRCRACRCLYSIDGDGLIRSHGDRRWPCNGSYCEPVGKLYDPATKTWEHA